MKHASLKHFSTPFSLRKSMQIVSHLCHQLLPRNHRYLQLIRDADWSTLAHASVDYDDALCAGEVAAERQVLAFFQKNACLPLGVDRRAVAREKMMLAERECAITNWRISNGRLLGEGLDSHTLSCIARKIDVILGPLPSLEELSPGFGPGVNVGTSRLSSARHKMSVKPTYTANAAPLVERMLVEFPHWDYLGNAEEANYGKLAFVPKDAKTDRTIETQPIINAFLQKGYGDWMKKRLLQSGCDLRRGQTTNARLALRGSLQDDYATIDLSSASDTISSLLVLELLPPEWFSALEAVRTPKLKIGKQFHELHRFSAMGNGYTFELESLIFYAVCKTVCEDEEVHVYGDDIVVPSKHAARVIEILHALGFTVNTGKTFVRGRFRESCGKDYFDGVDVRPCYLKGAISVKELFRFHNFFFRRGQAYMAAQVLTYIKKQWRHITGPDGFGDGHLLSLYPNLMPHGRDLGYAGWTFRTVSSKPAASKGAYRGDYAAILYLNSTGLAVPARNPFGDDGPGPASRTYKHVRGSDGWKLRRIYTLWG